MADQVERVEIEPEILRERLELQPRLFQFVDDRLLSIRAAPPREKVVEAGKMAPQFALREIPEALCDQLAVLVEVFDALGHDLDRDVIDVDLPGDHVRTVPRRQNVDDRLFVIARHRRDRLAIVRGRYVRRRNGIIGSRFVDLNRIAVEVGIGEMVGRFPEVDQREVVLLGLLVNSCATPQDLLELRHRLDFPVERNHPTGLRIHARREQPRRRDDHRELRLGIDEAVELLDAFLVVPGDSHHIALVLRTQVAVLVGERLSHAGGVFGVDAEHDRFLEAIPALFQQVGNLPGYQLGPIIDHERPIEVLLVVDPIFDFVAFAIDFPRLGPVALDVAVDVNLDHLVRREEAVMDALLQRIGVDRFAEVVDVRDVPGLLGRRRHADLRGRREVFEDLAPGGILRRAAAMALVDDDQIEEVR